MGSLDSARSFAANVATAEKAARDLHRMLGDLIREASQLGVLRDGPAEDASTLIDDAFESVGAGVGTLRQVQFGLAALFGAEDLPARVVALGWKFDGWVTGAGWVAWREWEAGAKPEHVADRSPAALLLKLELRNAEEARHV